MQRRLAILPESFAVARLEPDAALPDWLEWSDPLVAAVRTREEVSIVCLAVRVPESVQAESGWRAFKLEGPIPFAETGVLASLAQPLGEAGISIFALSTYDTDYVLVRAADLDRAAATLAARGFLVAAP